MKSSGRQGTCGCEREKLRSFDHIMDLKYDIDLVDGKCVFLLAFLLLFQIMYMII